MLPIGVIVALSREYYSACAASELALSQRSSSIDDATVHRKLAAAYLAKITDPSRRNAQGEPGLALVAKPGRSSRMSAKQ